MNKLKTKVGKLLTRNDEIQVPIASTLIPFVFHQNGDYERVLLLAGAFDSVEKQTSSNALSPLDLDQKHSVDTLNPSDRKKAPNSNYSLSDIALADCRGVGSKSTTIDVYDWESEFASAPPTARFIEMKMKMTLALRSDAKASPANTNNTAQDNNVIVPVERSAKDKTEKKIKDKEKTKRAANNLSSRKNSFEYSSLETKKIPASVSKSQFPQLTTLQTKYIQASVHDEILNIQLGDFIRAENTIRLINYESWNFIKTDIGKTLFSVRRYQFGHEDMIVPSVSIRPLVSWKHDPGNLDQFNANINTGKSKIELRINGDWKAAIYRFFCGELVVAKLSLDEATPIGYNASFHLHAVYCTEDEISILLAISFGIIVSLRSNFESTAARLKERTNIYKKGPRENIGEENRKDHEDVQEREQEEGNELTSLESPGFTEIPTKSFSEDTDDYDIFYDPNIMSPQKMRSEINLRAMITDNEDCVEILSHDNSSRVCFPENSKNVLKSDQNRVDSESSDPQLNGIPSSFIKDIKKIAENIFKISYAKKDSLTPNSIDFKSDASGLTHGKGTKSSIASKLLPGDNGYDEAHVLQNQKSIKSVISKIRRS